MAVVVQQTLAYHRQLRLDQLQPTQIALPNSFVILDRWMFLPVSMVLLWKFSKQLSSFGLSGTCSHDWYIQSLLGNPIPWEIPQQMTYTPHWYSNAQPLVAFYLQSPAVQCSAIDMAEIDLSLLLLFLRAAEVDSEKNIVTKMKMIFQYIQIESIIIFRLIDNNNNAFTGWFGIRKLKQISWSWNCSGPESTLSQSPFNLKFKKKCQTIDFLLLFIFSIYRNW